jgi:hypothetical protein
MNVHPDTVACFLANGLRECRTRKRRPSKPSAPANRGVALVPRGNRLRHEGCGGLPAKAELLTGIDGVSSSPVRRIVLRSG